MHRNRHAIALFCSVLLAVEGVAASYTSSLGPLRTAVLDEIAFVSSDVTTSNAAALRPLMQARRALDRRTRVSITSDLQMLAAAATVLNRSDYAELFAPVIDETVATYSLQLEDLAAGLGDTLDALPENSQVAAATRTLETIDALRERANNAPNAEIAARLLSRVALQMTALQSSVARLTRGSTTASTLTAFVGGLVFTATDNVTATYSPGLGVLTIGGTQADAATARTLTLSLRNVRPGTTTQSLGSIGTGDYGLYSERGTNVVSYTSVSGSATVTLDTINRTVSGTFSFVGASRAGLDTPVQVSGGTFSLPLR